MICYECKNVIYNYNFVKVGNYITCEACLND